ncbi:integral membrane protein [Fusarium beomiforme]|uniref:Integral membrane protein n=1 Tax=Fusarium beomiforme TaxID=44412 RepID=A0A9P5ABV8_9HYPO|nr:integral membrane protein [Fusarium beomiforme]
MPTQAPSIQITRYERPRGFGALIFGGAVLSYICFAGVAILPDESSAWQIIDDFLPGSADSFRWIIKTTVPPLIAIHTIEAVAFDLTRLAPHGASRGGLLWWKWILSCWIEGFFCWKRFASVVAAKKASADGARKR